MTVRLNYETHGSPKQPALLMVHGFMSCNGQWLANIERLSKRYYLVCVELWGHGASPTPTEESCYSQQSYAEQFEHIRQALGIESWSVVGQSYGAGIVLRYAASHQSACVAAVATNSRSAFGSMREEHEERSALPREGLDVRKLPYHPIHARRFPDHIKSELVSKADGMSADAIRLGGLLGPTLNCRELVVDYPLPLLIANGCYEKSFQEDLVRLRESSPDLNVVDLPGGHSVNIEAAVEFDDAVLSFLQRVPW